jgi:hypothetical protein
MKVTTFLLGALFAATATAVPVEGLGKRRLANDPITDQQLADAKANYTGIPPTSRRLSQIREERQVKLPDQLLLWRCTTLYQLQNQVCFWLNCVSNNNPPHATMTNSSERPAYTIKTAGRIGKIDGCPLCNAIGFCPTFWSTRVRYTNDVLKDTPALSDLASISTYEHVLIHEFMHNDITQVKPHSTFTTNRLAYFPMLKHYLYDPYTWGGKQNVYGDLKCARYSKEYFTRVNTKTLENGVSFPF